MGDLDVAIVGMAGRFPKADDVGAFWRNILEARECQTFFDRDELIAAGLPPEVIDRDEFIGVRGVLDAVDRFDAAFFGYSAREAECIDPQHRIFLEVAWNAFENAGYAPDRFAVPVGVFASCSQNTYQDSVLRTSGGDGDWKDRMLVAIGNQIEFLSSRVSYKLNLTGPSMTVQTACSSSLVAFHLACQSLLAGECDVALTGGSAVRLPQTSGQRYVEGGIYAPDGRCRAYSADARGVFSGNGVAAVVLKRLDDAVADDDWIYGIVKATAVNNDGNDKIGFTAPSETGQVAALRTALQLAGVAPSGVGYVEGHGTGTPLGDSIEIAALRSVFDDAGSTDPFCALGSVKSNVGHLDAAAGVAGVIKATLAVHHGVIPPQPHHDEPAPKLVEGPTRSFYLTGKASPWQSAPRPRVAAVTALGLGGTNANVVVSEAPRRPDRPAAEPHGIGGHFLAPLSASSDTSLSAMLDALPADLDAARDRQLTVADVSATLVAGRSLLSHRAVVFGRDLDGIAAAAGARPSPFVVTAKCEDSDAGVVFMYPGGGAHYRGMAKGLLATDRVFAEHIGECRAALVDATGADLVADVLEGDADLDDPAIGFGTLHLIEIALARTYLRRGVRPVGQIGHSLGEYTAAVIGGSLSLADSLRLVMCRSELLAEVRGAMLSVLAGADTVAEMGLLDDLSLAAVNGPDICTVSGSREAVAAGAARLAEVGVETKVVPITVPGHSTLLNPIVDRFRAELQRTAITTPEIPWISNVTGTTITAEDLADREYWIRHLMSTVRFGDGVTTLLTSGATNFLEVGPGQMLGNFVEVNAVACGQPVRTYRSMRTAGESADEGDVLARSFAELYCAGVRMDPGALYGTPSWRKVPMSGYRFDRARHWPTESRALSRVDIDGVGVLPDPDSWLTTPSWTRLPAVRANRARPGGRLVLVECDLPGMSGDDVMRLSTPADLPAALQDAARLVIGPDVDASGIMSIVTTAADVLGPEAVEVVLLTSRAVRVDEDDPVDPVRTGAIGALRVLGQENAGLRWQVIDVPSLQDPAPALINEIAEVPSHTVRAIRPSGRWEEVLVPTGIDGQTPPTRELPDGGTYVFTGGLGRFSLHIARHLCATRAANVVLTTRRDPAEATQQLPEPTAAAFRHLLADHEDQVRIVRCDVEDEGALTKLFDSLGSIAGVFHAAAVSTGRSVRALGSDMSTEDFQTQLNPKLHGAQALAGALHGREYQFCFLFSSNASRFGGAGRSAYAAANAAMEAFVDDQWRRGEDRWVTATWDGWRLDGEAARAVVSPLDRLALSAAEAARVVETVVTKAQTAVTVVSKGDVRERHQRWVRTTVADPIAPQPSDDERDIGRPVFGTDLEGEIAELWREVLGAVPASSEDSFFALGGHSLMGLRLVSRIKDRYNVPFEYSILVEHNTVGKVARWITARPRGPVTEAPAVGGPSRTLSELLKVVRETTS